MFDSNLNNEANQRNLRNGDISSFSEQALELLVSHLGDEFSGATISDRGEVSLVTRNYPEGLFSRGDSLRGRYPDQWQRIAEALETKRILQTSVSEPDGRCFALKFVPYVHDECRALVIARDITAMRNSRVELQRLANKFSELDVIVNSTSDGVWVCDGKGVVILVNPAAERINNVTAEEVIGKDMHDLVAEGFIDRSAAVEVIRTGRSVSLLQQRGDKKLTSTGTPVFDEQGNLVRVVVSTQDTTEIDALRSQLSKQELLSDSYRDRLLELQQSMLADNEIIVRSKPMVVALQQALKASASDSTILLLGESGTGKGLFADLIHKNSSRSGKPQLSLNCGAIPESLIESELFGYEKGAFTGANISKPGLLEVADGGTLFLDEIAELPLQSQVKLLGFLEDGFLTRLGSTRRRHVNVRVIAATHGDLQDMIRQKTFREDLYYRLNIIPITIPPLRERQDCIAPLLLHFIDYYSEKYGRPKRLTRAAQKQLMKYDYPGNVRQLINICERLVVMSEHELIDEKDLMGDISRERDYISYKSMVENRETLTQAVETLERSILAEACTVCSNQRQIADSLGISQASVARKLKKYGIERQYSV